MNLILLATVAWCLSLVVGWLAIPQIIVIAKAKRLFDTPSERKVHTGAIPRLGGIVFLPAIAISFCITIGFDSQIGSEYDFMFYGHYLREFLMVTAGAFILYMVGMADDLHGISARAKFLIQAVAAYFLTISGTYIKSGGGLFGIYELSPPFAVLFTVLFIVFTVNAFNLFDGIDGLCSSTAIAILLFFSIWFLHVGEYIYSVLAFSAMGVLVAFFYYNVLCLRLKIFMGDTGSLTIGFLIAFFALRFLDVENGEVHSPLAIIIGLLFVPLFDTARVFFIRLLRGESPFKPDKNHIHHKLLKLGLNHIQSTVVLVFATFLMLSLNIILSQLFEFGINFIIFTDIILGILTNVILNVKNGKKTATPVD